MTSPAGLKSIPRSFSRRARKGGVALVIVLGFLVLITALILAYFSSVSTETSTSKTYASGATGRFLADTAVNLVMGQIAKGTQGQSAAGERLTWASQPGMIRTFGTSAGPAGNYAEECYKLYSAPQMVIPASTAQSGPAVLQAMSSDAPMGWGAQPAIFTDLNAPVADSSGVWNFPIISGSGLSNLYVSGANVVTYGTANSPAIEGFYVNPNSIPVSNYNPTLISGTNNPVPMPVQWLYTLQDGTIIAPDTGGNGTSATFNTAEQSLAQVHWPSATNPIVGRVAFWTDDETCKLNINTASEGTFYSYSRTNTQTEVSATNGKSFGYSISPPAAGEYNRYPGHPASTCLSVALGNWLGNPNGNTAPNAYTSQTSDDAYFGLSGTNLPAPSQSGTGLAAYMLLSPRNALGGSMAGTVNEVSVNNFGITVNDDRLYASVDEILFRCPIYSGTSPDLAPPAARTPFPNPGLNKGALETLKFFLTASSRAPELTPFNTPKVSMWPQWYTQTDRTSLANYIMMSSSGATSLNYAVPNQALMTSYGLLAFCSSFGNCPKSSAWSGKNEYFFQRYNAGNTSLNDSSPASWEVAGEDWNNVPRNQALANYLCRMGAAPMPGYGAAFTGSSGNPKYNLRNFSDIVVKSLDFIRSASNLNYAFPSAGTNGVAATEDLIAPLVTMGNLPGVSGSSTAVKGLGYYPHCFQFVLAAILTSTSGVITPVLAINCFQPGVYEPWPFSFGLSVKIDNVAGLGISGTSNTISNALFSNSSQGPVTTLWYPFPNGYKFQTSGTGSGGTVTMGSDLPQPVTFTFLSASGSDAAQSITVNFPQVVIPMPTVLTPTWSPSVFASGSQCSARGIQCSGSGALGGDWRLLAGIYNLQADIVSGSGTTPIFTPAPNYSGTSITQAHFLWANGVGGGVYGIITQPIAINNSSNYPPNTTIAGTLVVPALLSSTDYMDESAPITPPDLAGAVMSNGHAGDWDTGPGLWPDGPYINPVDNTGKFGTGVYYNQGYTNYTFNFTTMSPNRMLSSPVRFGSLPTGCCQTPPQPWQTLLFCPNPAGRTLPEIQGAPPQCLPYSQALASGTNQHIGFVNPPDHLYLEFFTSPVVQPYPISEPLSTAGKVNLNYQIAPFTYIERSTALRGVLKNTLLTGIAANDVKGSGVHPTPGGLNGDNQYKWTTSPDVNRYPYEMRYDINRDATVAGIEEHYFNQGELFMYPSQICDVFLVPQYLFPNTNGSHPNYNPKDAIPPGSFAGNPALAQLQAAYDGMVNWWNSSNDLSKMNLTGDNLREEPYDRLYPRLTTKSNTYTVHYRVQVLQKRPNSNAAVWNEGQDQIVSEYRGSSLIERYVDPNDPRLTGGQPNTWDDATINLNFAENAGTATDASADLSQLYKFRVISTKKFAP